jgi:hypothetical protein
MTQSNLVYARYLLPVLPLIFILFSIGLCDIVVKMCHDNRKSTLYIGLVVVLSIGFLADNTWASVHRFLLPKTSIIAQQWIQEHVPEGSTVFMEGGREHRSQYAVPLYNLPSNINVMIKEIELRDPGKATYWKLKVDILSQLDVPVYDLNMVARHEVWPSLETLIKNGNDFFIVDRRQFQCIKNSKSGSALKSREDFYCSLDGNNKISLVKVIEKTKNNWGPELEIYGVLR